MNDTQLQPNLSLPMPTGLFHVKMTQLYIWMSYQGQKSKIYLEKIKHPKIIPVGNWILLILRFLN